MRGSTLPMVGLADAGDELVASDVELDGVAGGEGREHARRGQVDEARAAGLAHLLDEERWPAPSRAGPCRSCRAAASAAHQHPQPLDVALRDAVRRVALERLLVGVERLRVAAELGERLAEPVEGVDIGAQLQQLAVRVDRLLPFAARGVRDGGIAELASLSGGRVGSSPSAMSDVSVSDSGGRRPSRPKGAPLYHRPWGVSTRAVRHGPALRAVQEQADEQPEEQPARRTRPPRRGRSASPRRASTAPAQV